MFQICPNNFQAGEAVTPFSPPPTPMLHSEALGLSLTYSGKGLS